MGIDTRMPGFGVRIGCGRRHVLPGAATISMQGGSRWGTSYNLTGAGGGIGQGDHLAIVQRRIHAVDSQPRRGRQLQLAQRHGGVLDTAHDHPVDAWGKRKTHMISGLACCLPPSLLATASLPVSPYLLTTYTHTHYTLFFHTSCRKFSSIPPSFTWWSTC